MRLSVIPTSPIPAYRQLYDEILSQVISGELKPGDALPPIRIAAKELGISVITVRTAWEALEADGLIVTRSGSGCFIADLGAREIREKRKAMLEEPLARLAEAAKKLGFTKEEIMEMVDKAY